MPKAYTNMQAFNRAFLQRDYYTETAEEDHKRAEYLRKKADEDSKGGVIQLATKFIAAGIGFVIGGPPGAKIGWTVGGPIGRQHQKNRSGYFEGKEYLKADIFTTGGKFNANKDREWARTENQYLKEEEEAAVIMDTISLGMGAYSAFQTDWAADFGEDGVYEGWRDWGKKGDKWNLHTRAVAIKDYYKPFNLEEFLKSGANSSDGTINENVIKGATNNLLDDEKSTIEIIESVSNAIIKTNDELELNDTNGIAQKWLGGSGNLKRLLSKLKPKQLISEAKIGIKEMFTDNTLPGEDIITPVMNIPQVKNPFENTSTLNVKDSVSQDIIQSTQKSYDVKKKVFDLSMLNPFKDRDIIDWDSMYSGTPNQRLSGINAPVMNIPSSPSYNEVMGVTAMPSKQQAFLNKYPDFFNVDSGNAEYLEAMKIDNRIKAADKSINEYYTRVNEGADDFLAKTVNKIDNKPMKSHSRPDILAVFEEQESFSGDIQELDRIANSLDVNIDQALPPVDFNDLSSDIPIFRDEDGMQVTKLHHPTISEEVMSTARNTYIDLEQIDSHAEYNNIMLQMSEEIGLPEGLTLDDIDWTDQNNLDNLPFETVLSYFKKFGDKVVQSFSWMGRLFRTDGAEVFSSEENIAG